jgi:hypothetical protein
VKQTIIDSLTRYRDHHLPTGGFLRAVLENNLSGALGGADDDNLRDLREIVRWVYNEMPGNAWGSAEKVKAWIKEGLVVR